jgi:hypothetical protein
VLSNTETLAKAWLILHKKTWKASEGRQQQAVWQKPERKGQRLALLLTSSWFDEFWSFFLCRRHRSLPSWENPPFYQEGRQEPRAVGFSILPHTLVGQALFHRWEQSTFSHSPGPTVSECLPSQPAFQVHRLPTAPHGLLRRIVTALLGFRSLFLLLVTLGCLARPRLSVVQRLGFVAGVLLQVESNITVRSLRLPRCHPARAEGRLFAQWI